MSNPIDKDEIIAKTCERCRTLFESRGIWVMNRFSFHPSFCPTCVPIEQAERAEAQRQDRIQLREREWRYVCPDEFLELDEQLLPDSDLYRRVMAWKYGPRGLVVAGGTGTGKTRSCWAMLKREFIVGHSVCAVTAFDLTRYPAMLVNDPTRADALLERLAKVKIAYFDDPFKSRLSPSVEELLFAMLDERTSRRRPCIFSLNDSAATLLERFSTDRAKAFVRRIRDFCDVVKPTSTI